MTREWSFRRMEVDDLPALMAMQEPAAVAGMGNIFPQVEFPFPRDEVRGRWNTELRDPAIAAYVATTPDGRLVGFAARREDEVLHFGTALETWGSGLATWLLEALLATYPADLPLVRLRVFAGNLRARGFYEKLGWEPTGRQTRTSFPPHPTLLEYRLDRTGSRAAG